MTSLRLILATCRTERRALRLPLFSLLALLALLACSDDNENPTSPDGITCPPGQWAPDTGNYRVYRHDCEPYTEGHFTIFSDAASQASEAYRNGFLTVAVDYGAAPGAYQRDPWGYLYVLKHELTHVFQFTLTDCPSNAACPTWLDVWFREGQAVVTGGGFQRPTLQTLNDWRADPDNINPIRISRWNDFPDENTAGGYYQIFALAYAWLVDAEDGHGATIRDMKDMFQHMAEGDSFHDAFERALGSASPTWRRTSSP